MSAHRRRRARQSSARRSSARRSTAIKWLDVQPELRNMILEDVISASFTSTDEEPVRLAPLASVCKEWQAFFEHHIFRRLVIRNEDLEVFSKALAPPNEHRIKYIKHIQLRVTLAPYECPDCRKSESRETRAANNQRFTEAVTGLLRVLSRWDPAVHSSERIALELSAHSPSDYQHGLNHLYQRREFPYQFAEDLERAPGLPTYLPEQWGSAMQARNEHMDGTFVQWAERERFEGSPLILADSRDSGMTGLANPFPPCPIVKEFAIRFTCHRTFNGRSLAQILDALTELESFRWERWDLNGSASLFHNSFRDWRSGLSPTVHQVSLAYMPKRIKPHTIYTISENTHEVAYMAHGLRNLCIDTDINASWLLELLAGKVHREDGACFYPMPQRPWENLERLLIHDTTFVPALDWERMRLASDPPIPVDKLRYERNYHPPEIDHLYEMVSGLSQGLLRASRAARKLPNLRVMELAHISSTLIPFIYIFTYSSHGERESAKITLHLTKNTALYLPPEVGEAWRKTAIKVHGHKRFLPPETMYMPDSAQTIRESQGWCLAKYLALRDLWLDPTTVAQLEAEMKWRNRRESWIRTVQPVPVQIHVDLL